MTKSRRRRHAYRILMGKPEANKPIKNLDLDGRIKF